MTKIDTPVPTEIWTPNSNSFELGDAIQNARREMNGQDPSKLIDRLKQDVQRPDTGIVFAILKGEHPEEYSQTDALVLFNAFAQTATPNMLVQAEFIRLVAKYENVRDNQGKLKPVIMLASPGILGSRLNLSKEDKRQIREGSLGVAAEKLLRAVSAQEYGRVALLGFSAGADLALSGAQKTQTSNLDLRAISIGDPAGVENRKKYQLAVDLVKSASHLQEAIESGKIIAQKAAIGSSPLGVIRNRDFIRFGGISLTPTNRAIWAALGHNNFESQMQGLLRDEGLDKIVVGYGGESDVTKPSAIEPSLLSLHNQTTHKRLISVRIEGKNHPWGNQLPLLAKLYMRALV